MSEPREIESPVDLTFLLSEPQPWRRHAACLGMDPGQFFPEQGQPTTIAKQACRRCPVKQECDEYATAAGEQGIWAGKSRR